MSWEKKGPWVAPDYFRPFGGEEAFRAATDGLHAGGHRALVFLSGLNWTLRKTVSGPPIDDMEAFDARGRPHAIADASGEAQFYGKPDAGVGEFAKICAATTLGREILLGSSLECQRLGIDCVQADQIVGGGLPLCYSPDHGHPPGGGDWCSRRLLELFSEIRREGKARDPEFAFAMEEPGEFFIPVLDTYHARDYMQARWPRSGNGVYGVPLFTHVYHDYVHGYGGDSCPVSSNESPTAVYAQGMNMVCGKAPGVAVWTRDFDPLTTHETQKRLLSAHCALWHGPARDFLVFGQRMTEPPLDVPAQALIFRDWSRPGGPRTEVEVPSVLRGSWRLPDGRVGRVYVNVTGGPISFAAPGGEIRLEPGEAAFRQN
jgi:hypothetical protein